MVVGTLPLGAPAAAAAPAPPAAGTAATPALPAVQSESRRRPRSQAAPLAQASNAILRSPREAQTAAASCQCLHTYG